MTDGTTGKPGRQDRGKRGAFLLRPLILAPLLLQLFPQPVPAADPGSLYVTQVYVTGQREETRYPAFAQGFTEVLVKVSGDPSLAESAAVKELAARAESFLADFRYRDRMEGIPLGDEQGSRDRPYDLTLTFRPEKIDAALRELKREPWPAARPAVVVFLAVRNGAAHYILTEDGERGRDQRDSLAAAARKFGVPLRLPDEQALAAADLLPEAVATADLAHVEQAAKAAGGETALAGHMTWHEAALGWTAEWRLRSNGHTYRWGVAGVNFDEVFRRGAGGALQILSGNGAPR